VFLTFLMLWILVGNFLVVWTVYVTRRMHFAAFYFVASLSVADFLVGLLVLPISIAYHLIYEMKGQWTFGLHTCNFWLFANFWFCSASVFNLCLVSWDRYVAVTSPLHYQTRMCEERVVKLIAGNWAWSLVLAGCLIIGFHFSQQRVICSVKGIDPEILLVAVITMFILPCIFLVFVNLKVWFITLEQVKESKYVRGLFDRGRRRTIKQEIKTFRIFLVVIGVFVACWTPFFVVMLMGIFSPVSGFVLYITIVLTYCNSALNSLIYGVLSRNCRRA
ncbi:predicted protein, partial [Nematostella vectensis]